MYQIGVVLFSSDLSNCFIISHLSCCSLSGPTWHRVAGKLKKQEAKFMSSSPMLVRMQEDLAKVTDRGLSLCSLSFLSSLSLSYLATMVLTLFILSILSYSHPLPLGARCHGAPRTPRRYGAALWSTWSIWTCNGTTPCDRGGSARAGERCLLLSHIQYFFTSFLLLF